jgi:hypothetical protein
MIFSSFTCVTSSQPLACVVLLTQLRAALSTGTYRLARVKHGR